MNKEDKTLKSRSTGEIMDMHNYILRSSKKKDRQALALESIDSLQSPETVRVSNYKQTFEELT